MIAFLTSSPGDFYLENGVQKPCRLSEANGFLRCLTAVWPERACGLLICAEPDNTASNDEMCQNFQEAFAMSSIPFAQLVVCDARNAFVLPSLLEESNVVILSGGHTLTQNRFFKQIDLKRYIKSFGGVLIGISGGSMNSASVVYAQPERESDLSDPTYDRFPEGLGLTDVMILPHYQVLKDRTLQGLRLIEDVAVPDSMGRTFCALPDGSYVQLKDGKAEIMGKAFMIHDGHISPM